MALIKILPPHIANKIAAGEVVDRPASVVKELVENALDADSREITIIMDQAGKELIQVIDNGRGMDEEDMLLAFERHATSKISDVSDLDNIRTLGFRGEALPSIASVSRLEVKTCPRGQDLGFLINIDGGIVSTQKRVAMKGGTSIAVKNLFYNTPARRNFLRADSTEFTHILRWLKRFFLAHPTVQFRVIHNGEEIFDLPSGSIDERISNVFGKKFYQQLVFIRQEMGGITLEGYVCKPDHARGRNDNQFIFLNQRAIINRSLAHAVLQGYGNLIERSKYPQFILSLTIPPQQVDVNVHPTKMEVRFTNEQAIYHLFLSSVRQAIQNEDIVPNFNFKANATQQKEIASHFQAIRQPSMSLSSGSLAATQQDAPEESQISFSYDPMPTRKPETKQESQEGVTSPARPNLWQIHNRYILSQIKSGLVIIDQHVAHERILYEQILDHLNQEKTVPSQQLLFPQTVEFSLEDYLIYEEIKSWLTKIGFVINELSGRTIVIEAIPADVRVGNESKIIFEIIDFYRTHEGERYEAHEKIAAAYACKNAIKSGEKLTLEAMNALVDQLFVTREPYFCPHGRPVIVTLSLEEFDRKFKRI